jgi:hypothetical protein
MTGFGKVKLLPGIWDSLQINTAGPAVVGALADTGVHGCGGEGGSAGDRFEELLADVVGEKLQRAPGSWPGSSSAMTQDGTTCTGLTSRVSATALHVVAVSG